MDANCLTLGLLLIGAGFLLLVAESFVPHGGVLAVVAVGCLCVGVGFTFAHDTSAGVLTLVGVFVALPIVCSVLLHYWPRSPIGRQFVLKAPEAEDTVASLPVNQELEHLRGRYGKTLSALRPAGVVDFDGRRVDTLTEGMMVEPGQWVRCVDVRAGKVIVRPAERPSLDTLETGFFG
jgi:membrane-bound serine protease (ClpP class)